MDDIKRAKSTTTDGLPPREGYENLGAPAPIELSSGQHEAYWVLTEEERSKGFVRPVRDRYIHEACGEITVMGPAIAETYAREPGYYSRTMCVHCRGHYPVGPNGEFIWPDGERVGT